MVGEEGGTGHATIRVFATIRAKTIYLVFLLLVLYY